MIGTNVRYALSEAEERFADRIAPRLQLYNGGTECDVLLYGPCSCGATHSHKELARRCGPKIWQQVVYDCKEAGVDVPEGLDKQKV
jgi:hypothetical protein